MRFDDCHGGGKARPHFADDLGNSASLFARGRFRHPQKDDASAGLSLKIGELSKILVVRNQDSILTGRRRQDDLIGCAYEVRGRRPNIVVLLPKAPDTWPD